MLPSTAKYTAAVVLLAVLTLAIFGKAKETKNSNT
jgi:hypothetical protein